MIIKTNLSALNAMKDVHLDFYFQFLLFFLGRQCSIKSDDTTDDQNNNNEAIELTCSACYSGYFLYENACITSCSDGI